VEDPEPTPPPMDHSQHGMAGGSMPADAPMGHAEPAATATADPPPANGDTR